MSINRRLFTQLGLIAEQGCSKGIDLMLGNGLRLYSNIKQILFDQLDKRYTSEIVPQNWRSDPEEYKTIYSGVADYSNLYSCDFDGKNSLVWADAGYSSLLHLRDSLVKTRSTIACTTVLRGGTANYRSLETVRLHQDAPAFHLCIPKNEIRRAQGDMVEVIRDLFKSIMCDVTIEENRRDVSHYASWSVSAYVDVGSKNVEAVAGYQLSRSMCASLGLSDFELFELSISTRLMACLVMRYHRTLETRLTFPSNIAPVQLNIIFNGARQACVTRRVVLHFQC